MKNFIAILYILSALICISCNESNTQNTIAKNPNRFDSLTVVLDTTYKGDVVLGYEDLFGNYFDIVKGANKIPANTFIRDRHWQHGVLFYAPDSISKIIFRRDSLDFFYAKTADKKSDKIVNFELSYLKEKKLISLDDFMKDRTFCKNDTDLDNMNEALTKKFDEKRLYLSKYSEVNKLGVSFEKLWRNVIDYEERNAKLRKINFGKNSVEKLNSLAQNTAAFNNDSMLFIQDYRIGVRKMRDVLTFVKKGANIKSFKDLLRTSEENFKGKTKEWLMLDLLLETHKKENDYIYNEGDFNTAVADFLKTATVPEFKEYLSTSLDFKDVVIQKDEVMDYQKKVRKLSEIGNNHFTYIDFWASWCGPCRAEMPSSRLLKEEYSNKGINFVYISTDENPAAWKKALKQIGLPETDSYLLPKGTESSIAKQFNISSIPRYMIMDKEGKIIDQDAPRPSDPKIRGVFDKLLGKSK